MQFVKPLPRFHDTSSGPACLKFAPLLILAAAFLVMAFISWRRWPDIMIDFGRELYIPWQIASGQVLYTDIAHLFGPLSSYFNALLFLIFGVSYNSIFCANLVLTALFTTLLYRFLIESASRTAAFAGCMIFLSGFAFSQFVMIGNYNFISPFSHEATHGSILALLQIYLMSRFSRSGRIFPLAGSGFLAGLVFLTKAEIFFAMAISSLFFFIFLYPKRESGIPRVQAMLVFFFTWLVPVSLFLIFFVSVMPLSDALRSVLGSWALLVNSPVANNRFYKALMGVNDISGNAARMVMHVSLVAGPAGLGLICNLPRRGDPGRRKPGPAALIWAVGMLCLAIMLDPVESARSLPLLAMISLPALMRLPAIVKENPAAPAPCDRSRNIKLQTPILLWTVYSIALLPKIALNCRLSHYGFYLAMPAAVLVGVMAVWFLPGQLSQSNGRTVFFRNTMMIFLLVLCFRCVIQSNHVFRMKNFRWGIDPDTVTTYHPMHDNRGPLTMDAIHFLQEHMDEKQTLIVIPEGIMMNYQLRRSNPTRFINFMPPELSAFGEQNILRDIIADPPDYFAVVHKDTSEYGTGFFGSDPGYGKIILDWVKANYIRAGLFGSEPLVGSRFGVLILKKRSGLMQSGNE